MTRVRTVSKGPPSMNLHHPLVLDYLYLHHRFERDGTNAELAREAEAVPLVATEKPDDPRYPLAETITVTEQQTATSTPVIEEIEDNPLLTAFTPKTGVC
ncbi:hypothetical protein V6N13_097641 [Hibiscus sabdariffa]|uniref:Uncharacterized protein n=1 Tax=Hibiscus sabdariffa TaxID=183260 RepID=A0ABR2BUH8_9ROSI